MKIKILSVTEVTERIKILIESDNILSDLFIRGEISNFVLASSGHMYFTLKDKDSSISCVLFKNQAQNLSFIPENGMNVTSYGRVSVYEKTGKYQLYVEFIEPYGKGALYIAFEQLKNKLLEKGYFDEKHKKPIPFFPKKIAVITSPTGAAVKDIISVIKRRNPFVSIVVVATLVQGLEAAKSIAEAIDFTNKNNLAELIIVGRGGGSAEDLWAFNEEIVALAAFKSKIPIISAVGHETDFTIIDFVADLRAATPSVAAELAVPIVSELDETLSYLLESINYKMKLKLDISSIRLNNVISSNTFKKPEQYTSEKRNCLDVLEKNLNKEMNLKIKEKNNILYGKISLIENLSPLKTLKRGYGIIQDENKNVISSIKNLTVSSEVGITLNDGNFTAKVLQMEEN